MGRFPKPSDTSTPFLNVAHFGKKGTTKKVQLAGNARKVDSTFSESGEQVVVDVKIGKAIFGFGLDPDKPNYRILCDRFGDPSKWTKGAFTLTVLTSKNGGRPYLAVVDSEK